jgi:YrbI family 3-deoxy-D-manno-octulosonate 8-phosphate phosphatase
MIDFSETEIIVSEVDGVITNDLDAIDVLNNTLFKNYYMKDFEAINLLKPYFTFVFLSSDASISYGVMRTRQIPFYFIKNKNEKKVDILRKIISRYNTTPDSLIYIGSRLSDTECMELSNFSVVPYDAPNLLRNRADYVVDVLGGQGVISQVYDLLQSNKSKFNT